MNKMTSIAGCLLVIATQAACQPDTTRDAPVTTKTPAGQSTAPSASAAAQRDNALVRFVHAIPAGAAVDLMAGLSWNV